MGSRVKRKKTTPSAGGRYSHTRSDRLLATVISILLVGVVWIAFGQTLRHEFVNYDDGSFVYANPRITSGLTIDNVKWAFTHFRAGNWQPLTVISHMLDCQLYGLQPWGHHLTNVLLHAAAVILLLLALWQLTDNLWASAFVAALFAIHPLRVEPVAWVSGRGDVLSGVFFMLTLLAYARYARSDRFSLGRYAMVLVLFALGLMCKPTLVTVPFVLLLLDYWPLGRVTGPPARLPARESFRISIGAGRWSAVRVLLLEKIPFFALSAASCVAAILAREVTPGEIHHAFAERAGNVALFYIEYLGQMIYPAHLAVLYPYPETGPGVPEVILALLFLCIVCVVLFIWRRRYPFLLIGWLWFLGMLVPMIGLVQIGSIARADRYTYLAEIGLYILGTWGAMALFKSLQHKREILSAAALVITGAFITRSYFQGACWKNSETLWRHTVAVTHDNYIAQNNLGGTLLEQGQLNEAIAHYREAVEIKPDVPEVQSNLGNALVREGEVEEAIGHLQKALQIDPSYAEAYNYMGNALMKKGETGEAVRYYQKAVALDTSYADAHNNLGAAFWRNGQLEEAIAHYKEAVAINPGSAEIQFNLGNALAREGDWAGAIACYEAALSTERDSVKAARLRNNLGGALERIGKSDEAFEQFNKAVQINESYPEAHCNLARMLAQQGRRDEAVAHLKEALRLRPGYEQAKKQLSELGVTTVE
jgi:tetratricopeptide (TPR) repeat protein/cbb3-type cytochrome oxidase subunit 3